MAKQFARSVPIDVVMRHRYVYSTSDPNTTKIISRDAQTKYRQVQLPDGFVCECRAGSIDPAPECWHVKLVRVRRGSPMAPRARSTPKPTPPDQIKTPPVPPAPPPPPALHQTADQTAGPPPLPPLPPPISQATERPEPQPGPHVPPPPISAEPPPPGHPTAEMVATQTESNGEVQDVPVDQIPANQKSDGEEPVRRRPGRPRKVDLPARQVVELDPTAPFRPVVMALHATAKRVVNVGPYESFEIQAHIQAEPDPHHPVGTNLTNLVSLVVTEVNNVADVIGREIKLGKG
jgi:hypothetical protein